MSRGKIAALVVLAGVSLSAPALALPGRDAINAARDAARGAIGELSASITIHTRNFVADYSTNDRYMIEAARIAKSRSAKPQVQAFADTLAADAKATEAELQRLLRAYNVDATLAPGLDGRRRGMLNELNTTPAFTRRYLDQQVLIQKEQRILLRRYSHSGKIVAMQQFAARRLRKVEDFLATLQQLQHGA